MWLALGVWSAKPNRGIHAMTEEDARAKVREMTNAQILELYNRLSGNRVRRFSSRAIGERRLAELLQAHAEVRTVSRMEPEEMAASQKKRGRPETDFTVTLATGRSRPQPGSLRGKILAFMGDPNNNARSLKLSALIQNFGEKTKAAVQKLCAKGWLKKTLPE